jgi:surface carbohydrate biosynthesis protein
MSLPTFSRPLRPISRLLRTRFEWTKPQHAEVAILDASVASELLEYLDGYSVGIVDLDGRRLNLWALIRVLVKGRLTQFDYLCEYLYLMQPRLCITLIDTTPYIYRIKSRIPSIKTISIQNGWRGFETKRDLERQSKPLKIDHMLCFGEAAKTTYSESISGTFHLIGGFRSNKVPVQTDPQSNIVALISTLRPKVNLSEPATSYSSFPPVTYSEIFERRLTLATYVAEFCRQASLRLIVIGKDFDSSRECEMYTRTLGQSEVDWEFCPRTELLESYQNLDRARIAVSTSSSLGYEAIGRGIRTASFMLDPEITGNWGDKFGWPLIHENEGTIWTNYLDRERTMGMLWKLHEMSDAAWQDLRSEFVPQLITTDPGNKTLGRLISMCLKDHTELQP